MKFFLITTFLFSMSCNTSIEGRAITDGERESVMREEQRKQACLSSSKSNDEYIECVASKK